LNVIINPILSIPGQEKIGFYLENYNRFGITKFYFAPELNLEVLNWHMIYSFLSFFAGIVSASIAIMLSAYWKNKSARLLMLLMISTAIWSLAYGVELNSPSLSVKLWWVKVAYVGAVWVGVLNFCFILSIVHEKWRVNKLGYTVLIAIPVFVFILVLTNSSHHLIWSNAWLNFATTTPVTAFSRGAVFWCFVFFSYILLLFSTIILIHALGAARGIFKKQLLTVVAGMIFPWFSNILYLFGFKELQYFDLTPIAFALSGIAFSWGLLRYQMLGLISLAHETVLNSMGDPVMALDMNDRILDMNKVAHIIFEIKAFSPAHITLKDHLPVLYEKIVMHRRQYSIETEVAFSTGQLLREWNLRISPLLNRKEQRIGWLIILRDITWIKKTERELRNTKNFIRSIIDSMPSTIIGLNAKGVVKQWNSEACTLTGISAEYAKGRLIEDVFPELLVHISNVDQTIDKQKIKKESKVTLTIGEKSIFADITIYPILSNSVPGAVIRVDDISERVKIEEMMVQSEKMLSVGGLAAGMAHEINNPLAGVLQNLQVIQNRLCKDIPANRNAAKECGIYIEDVTAYMEKRNIFPMIELVKDSGRRAARIVSNMLSFSRKSQHRKSAHQVSRVMEDTIVLMKNDYSMKKQYDFKAIKILKESEKGIPAVMCERSEIQQVFLNVLKNGAEAMMDAGVAVPVFTLRYLRQDNYVVIEIEDNGPGIQREIRKRIFEPFFTTKDVGFGTGLGLSVSYFIITENHNGILSVESIPGKGSVFIIKLPIHMFKERPDLQ